jgi:hypothetical protein
LVCELNTLSSEFPFKETLCFSGAFAARCTSEELGLSQADVFLTIHSGTQRFSDEVMTAAGMSLSLGTPFKLGITNFLNESEQSDLLPLNTPHKKYNMFHPANNNHKLYYFNSMTFEHTCKLLTNSYQKSS